MLRTLSVATNATTTDDEMKANLEYERKAAIRKKNANRAEERRTEALKRSRIAIADFAKNLCEAEVDQDMVEKANQLMMELDAQCVSKYYTPEFLATLNVTTTPAPEKQASLMEEDGAAEEEKEAMETSFLEEAMATPASFTSPQNQMPLRKTDRNYSSASPPPAAKRELSYAVPLFPAAPVQEEEPTAQ